MLKKKKFLFIAFILSASVLFSGCFLTKKKCDCPKFSKAKGGAKEAHS